MTHWSVTIEFASGECYHYEDDGSTRQVVDRAFAQLEEVGSEMDSIDVLIKDSVIKIVDQGDD